MTSRECHASVLHTGNTVTLHSNQVKVNPVTCQWMHTGWVEVQLSSFFNLRIRRGVVNSMPRPLHRYPLYRRLDGPGPVWTGVENIALTGVRTPNHAAHRQSLYWLSYPGQKAEAFVNFSPLRNDKETKRDSGTSQGYINCKQKHRVQREERNVDVRATGNEW
jgi:hypothetical protein